MENTKAIAEKGSGRNLPRIQKITGKVVGYIILAIGAIVVSVPWIWMLLTSLKTPADILRIPLSVFPKEWMWVNYDEVFTGSIHLGRSVWNSLKIVFVAEIGVLLSNTLVSFSFSRLKWKARDTMFIVVIATMMLPAQVTMIPVFTMFTTILHWRNTYLPLTIGYFFGAASFIFLLRQFMMTLPKDIDDAARIDGCNTFQLFWRVILPMSAPVLAVVSIFTFNGVWNDFFGPLLYIDKIELFTLAQTLANIGASGAVGQLPRYDLIMAASVLASLPMAALFFVFQRQFIQGVVITGVKG